VGCRPALQEPVYYCLSGDRRTVRTDLRSHRQDRISDTNRRGRLRSLLCPASLLQMEIRRRRRGKQCGSFPQPGFPHCPSGSRPCLAFVRSEEAVEGGQKHAMTKESKDPRARWGGFAGERDLRGCRCRRLRAPWLWWSRVQRYKTRCRNMMNRLHIRGKRDWQWVSDLYCGRRESGDGHH
jgi:hypothetical protein